MHLQDNARMDWDLWECRKYYCFVLILEVPYATKLVCTLEEANLQAIFQSKQLQLEVQSDHGAPNLVREAAMVSLRRVVRGGVEVRE